MKNGTKHAILGIGVLAALTASVFLTPYIRRTACEKKYQGYHDKIDYAGMLSNKYPEKALTILDSLNISSDNLCKNEAREIEFLKYYKKAKCFKSLLMKNKNPSNLDSMLQYCDKAIAAGNNVIVYDDYIGIGDIYFLIGLTYQELGQNQTALPYLDKAIEESDKHKKRILTQINSRRIKTRCLEALGRTEEADLLEKETAPLDKILFQEISKQKH
jgi:tetratricopeptide (TPR) repeat protein